MTSPTLQPGARGEEVEQLQQTLLAAGYDPNGVDGMFGPGTEAAVRRLQGDHGLDVDGIAGPRTWGALAALTPRPVLRQGVSGDEVRRLQQTLLAAGYDPNGVDGMFGPGTEAAVRRLQGDRSLAADGVVGPQTWQALLAGGGSGEPDPEQDPPGGGQTLPHQGGLSSRGAAFIAHHEGCRLQLYNDPAGHCTIGVGHLVHHGNCNGAEGAELSAGISQERAFEILQTDAASAARAVLGAVTVPLSQAELDALISFVFNVGGGAFHTSTLLRKLNAGDRGAVPAELGRWTKAAGQDLPGLVTRRRQEGRLFAHGIYE
jgi:GH24 family phage-related lysozyme (muramidase)